MVSLGQSSSVNLGLGLREPAGQALHVFATRSSLTTSLSSASSRGTSLTPSLPAPARTIWRVGCQPQTSARTGDQRQRAPVSREAAAGGQLSTQLSRD